MRELKHTHIHTHTPVIELSLSAPFSRSSWQAVWLRPIAKGAVFSGWRAFCVCACVCVSPRAPDRKEESGPGSTAPEFRFYFLLFPSVQRQRRVLKEQLLIFSSCRSLTSDTPPASLPLILTHQPTAHYYLLKK